MKNHWFIMINGHIYIILNIICGFHSPDLKIHEKLSIPVMSKEI